MKDQPKALILANSMHLAYRVGWQREAAAELRRLPEIEAQRDEARRTAREAHEMGTRVVAQRDALLEALRWIAAVNATDREYQAKARAARKAKRR